MSADVTTKITMRGTPDELYRMIKVVASYTSGSHAATLLGVKDEEDYDEG